MALATVNAAPRRRLADDLGAAIEKGEIELRYQPQVAMANGRITGVEALARWRHQQLGELGADQLFAAARRAALLPELSRHIHSVALREVARWPASLASLRVAVNITALDLARPGFAADLMAQVVASSIAPARLTLELTEHDPVDDLPASALVLDTLREAGVAIALDDFGSGHSGVAWLLALPVDMLKLDGQLSGAALGPPRERAIVGHVIALARALGLTVVAEGVEREAHRAALAAAGASHYQGYLCAGPLDLRSLVALVEERACVR